MQSLRRERLSANLSFLFTEWPFLDRFSAAADTGFTCVEFLFPYQHAPDAIARQLERHRLALSVFNAPPGQWEGGERGLAALPGRSQAFRDSIELALDYASAFGAKRIHVMAGIADGESHAARLCYIDNLEFAVARASAKDVQILIEPINNKDMPGYFLQSFQLGAEIVRQLASEHLRLQFDLYHCQRINGSILDWLDSLLPITAHIQLAGIPDRHEPSADTLPLTEIFRLLDQRRYTGRVGCEYRPRGWTVEGLDWIDQLQRSLT